MSAAEEAERALARYLDSEERKSVRAPGLTRRIALVALLFHLRDRLLVEDAIKAAGDILGAQGGVTAAYLKKSKSEARAVVTAVVSAYRLPPADLQTDQFFTAIESILDSTSFIDATRRRAFALRGMRGGRRAKRDKPVLRDVLLLKGRAEKGDLTAIEELAAIRQALMDDRW